MKKLKEWNGPYRQKICNALRRIATDIEMMNTNVGEAIYLHELADAMWIQVSRKKKEKKV